MPKEQNNKIDLNVRDQLLFLGHYTLGASTKKLAAIFGISRQRIEKIIFGIYERGKNKRIIIKE